ncbi:PadR family transcriptional regulator [Micromonospora sp. WMMA1363]|uniref:PadR family transcriptional regulator n=1 Tax=Micromonospora sp. WMMA1363 TaxID=3053985 RepID=UPI00259C8F24|nr:PadR family transcriptional regulator [Micromonospora sp. WMMA1363]MDM4722175.1 PadR family transcriptional regulator [Micromonospora sp. WMMA1363]
MQEPTFLILTALATGPKHGYGVTREVAELSEGAVTLRAGTLYGALDRLVEQELVAVDRQEIVDGRLRRYYRLTDAGAARLAEQARRLRKHVAAAESRLQTRPDSAFGFPGSFGAPA